MIFIVILIYRIMQAWPRIIATVKHSNLKKIMKMVGYNIQQSREVLLVFLFLRIFTAHCPYDAQCFSSERTLTVRRPAYILSCFNNFLIYSIFNKRMNPSGYSIVCILSFSTSFRSFEFPWLPPKK